MGILGSTKGVGADRVCFRIKLRNLGAHSAFLGVVWELEGWDGKPQGITLFPRITTNLSHGFLL